MNQSITRLQSIDNATSVAGFGSNQDTGLQNRHEIMNSEQRHSLRKALKSTGRLVLDCAPPLEMRTINVARDGMAISSREPVIEGAHYRVDFDIMVDGTACHVMAGARVIFCVYAGQSEFKAGLRFIDLDPLSTAAIAGFLNY